jgi:hypothetical protein
MVADVRFLRKKSARPDDNRRATPSRYEIAESMIRSTMNSRGSGVREIVSLANQAIIMSWDRPVRKAADAYISGRVRDATMAHRYRFLWAVQEHVPEVLADLDRDVLPLFRAMFRAEPFEDVAGAGTFVFGKTGEQIEMLWIKWPSWTAAKKTGELWLGPSWKSDFLDVQLDAQRLKFKCALEEWAATYHLQTEAILEDAFSTLCFWIVNPQGNHRIWAPLGYSRPPEEIANAPKLRIDEGWAFEPWSAIEARLDKQVADYKSRIKEYCAKIRFDVDQVSDRYEHYAWLALFQCKGMAPEKIQQWNQQNNHRQLVPSAILHAIKKIAEKAGVERRPGERGPGRHS